MIARKPESSVTSYFNVASALPIMVLTKPIHVGTSISPNHQFSRVFILDPIFHRKAQQPQAVRRGRSRAAKNPPHMFVEVGKAQLHEQVAPQHLAHVKAG